MKDDSTPSIASLLRNKRFTRNLWEGQLKSLQDCFSTFPTLYRLKGIKHCENRLKEANEDLHATAGSPVPETSIGSEESSCEGTEKVLSYNRPPDSPQHPQNGEDL